MSKPLLKSHLLLTGNRLLGSLIYYKDKLSRPCLKLSFKFKLGKTSMWYEDKVQKQKIKIEDIKESEVSIDVSYKFDDRLVELKRENPNEKTLRKFIPVQVPMKSFLFMIKLKNWNDLPVVKTDRSSLLITPPIEANDLIIVFSFLGENGLPFMSKEHMSEYGRTVSADLPHDFPFNKICIGVIKDPNNTEYYDMVVAIPHENMPSNDIL